MKKLQRSRPTSIIHPCYKRTPSVRVAYAKSCVSVVHTADKKLGVTATRQRYRYHKTREQRVKCINSSGF